MVSLITTNNATYKLGVSHLSFLGIFFLRTDNLWNTFLSVSQTPTIPHCLQAKLNSWFSRECFPQSPFAISCLTTESTSYAVNYIICNKKCPSSDQTLRVDQRSAALSGNGHAELHSMLTSRTMDIPEFSCSVGYSRMHPLDNTYRDMKIPETQTVQEPDKWKRETVDREVERNGNCCSHRK